jgi:hypothetical protein
VHRQCLLTALQAAGSDSSMLLHVLDVLPPLPETQRASEYSELASRLMHRTWWPPSVGLPMQRAVLVRLAVQAGQGAGAAASTPVRRSRLRGPCVSGGQSSCLQRVVSNAQVGLVSYDGSLFSVICCGGSGSGDNCFQELLNWIQFIHTDLPELPQFIG